LSEHLPCNKSGNFDKVVTSCQQVVPNRQMQLSLRNKTIDLDVGFETKTWVLQQNVKIYSLVFSILACAWRCRKSVMADYQAIIGRLPIV
jgi:hypothetical protein